MLLTGQSEGFGRPGGKAGFNRKTDEDTICYYLQKFSDDSLMENLLNKLTDDELEEIFSLLGRLLKTHLSEEEYHRLFLKDRD